MFHVSLLDYEAKDELPTGLEDENVEIIEPCSI